MLLFIERQAAEGRGRAVDVIGLAIDLSRDAIDSGEMEVADRATKLAAGLAKRLPANEADRLRPRMRDQEREVTDIASVFAAAEQAARVLSETPADPDSHARTGFKAAVMGDWEAAIRHFLQSRNDLLVAASRSESTLPAEASADLLCTVASHWWDAAEAGASQKDSLHGEAGVNPSPSVQAAIRRHAATIYKRSLQVSPGMTDALAIRLAETRIAAANGAQQNLRLQVAEPALIVGSQAFDERSFMAAEERRSDLFEALGFAVSNQSPRSIQRIHEDLTAVRGEWSKALHLHNRDEKLARRQQLIQGVLARQPNCADAHLCACYLQMLDGKEAAAKASLGRATELIFSKPARQVFCAQQLIDVGEAALMLGERPLADKVKNLFRQGPLVRHPGVRLYEAMVFANKSMFSEAVSELEKVMANTEGLHRPTVTAEYAWLRAANPVERLRDKDAAAKAVEETLAASSGPQWKAWRARAALLAAEGRWDDAVASVDKAVLQAPLLFSDELERQRKSYEKKELYWIERRR
jgi:tetratricopeptide (TPR) repeat protein